jgi:hypothetical protein
MYKVLIIGWARKQSDTVQKYSNINQIFTGCVQQIMKYLFHGVICLNGFVELCSVMGCNVRVDMRKTKTGFICN